MRSLIERLKSFNWHEGWDKLNWRGRLTWIILPGLVLVVALVLTTVAGQGAQPTQNSAPVGNGVPTATQTVQEPPVDAPSEYDPYQYYLDHNPRPDVYLDREAAETRARLGCAYPIEQINTSPIDKVLAEAYRPLGICG